MGLVPLEAMLDAGRHYNGGDADRATLVNYAINGLMLDELNEFDPHSNIIEWAIQEDSNE